ncbi:MAG: hypothetical protein Q9195_003175 [Heterodermia aff. obscurata]
MFEGKLNPHFLPHRKFDENVSCLKKLTSSTNNPPPQLTKYKYKSVNHPTPTSSTLKNLRAMSFTTMRHAIQNAYAWNQSQQPTLTKRTYVTGPGFTYSSGSPSQGHGLSTGAIVGIVIGCVVGCVLILALAWKWISSRPHSGGQGHRPRNPPQTPNPPVVHDPAHPGNHGDDIQLGPVPPTNPGHGNPPVVHGSAQPGASQGMMAGAVQTGGNNAGR